VAGFEILQDLHKANPFFDIDRCSQIFTFVFTPHRLFAFGNGLLPNAIEEPS